MRRRTYPKYLGRRRLRRRSFMGLSKVKRAISNYGLPVGLGVGIPLAVNYVGRNFGPGPGSVFYEHSHYFGGLGAAIVAVPLIITGRTEKGIATLVAGAATTAGLWYYNTQYAAGGAQLSAGTGLISASRQMEGVQKGALPPRTGVGDIDKNVFSSSQSIV